jgi:hypothetical protein
LLALETEAFAEVRHALLKDNLIGTEPTGDEAQQFRFIQHVSHLWKGTDAVHEQADDGNQSNKGISDGGGVLTSR